MLLNVLLAPDRYPSAYALVNVNIHGDRGEVFAVLVCPVGGCAYGITEVVVNISRHDGVKVNDTQGPVIAVKEDIIELGVVMGYSQRNLALFAQPDYRPSSPPRASQSPRSPFLTEDTLPAGSSQSPGEMFPVSGQYYGSQVLFHKEGLPGRSASIA